MSENATLATQNGMTTCLKTSEKERFCSVPHRHGEATGKPETRDETRESSKTSISCETSANFHSWRPTKRRSFAACPIDTAKPQENQRLETRHVGAAKRALSTRYKTRLNVTKCHACHAKRSNETFETSKKDPFCRTYDRHGHTKTVRFKIEDFTDLA